MNITIGLQIAPHNGNISRMRQAWVEADALGADGLYVADHFFSPAVESETFENGTTQKAKNVQNFEATTIQAAMAATTFRAEIGCLVHANSYRNPNLLADIARTIDHISGGRFVLGIGSGYLKADYDEYGYEFGTQKTRLLALARDLPIIKARFEKLNPKPLRKIPFLIASMGEKIGLRIVAEHADIWHVFGPIEKMLEKQDALKKICGEIGRNYDEIKQITHHHPKFLPANEPDVIIDKLGITNIVGYTDGPDWDLGPLRELLAWRKTRQAVAP